MDVDWIVAIMVFLVFVVWSFSYYFTLFPRSEGFLESVTETDTEKIMNFLSANVYRIPVRVNSNGEDNVTLMAKSVWYRGTKNSTRIFKDGESLPCMIIGDDLYWLANLSSGWNYFYIEFSGLNTSLNCDSEFSLVNVTQTIPWVLERKSLLSLTRVNEMTNMSYEDFKENLDIEEDFNILLEWDGTTKTYGKPLPENREVYVKVYENLLWETSENINVSVRVW